MKVTISYEFNSKVEAANFLLEGLREPQGNAAAASPVPTGDPVPPPTVPRPGPTPVPAPQPTPTPLPTPSPMPPPAPSNNGGGQVTIQQVMGAMQEYAKIHKAAGIKNVLSHVGISKITEANPEQLLWLKGVFDLGQPMAAAS